MRPTETSRQAARGIGAARAPPGSRTTAGSRGSCNAPPHPKSSSLHPWVPWGWVSISGPVLAGSAGRLSSSRTSHRGRAPPAGGWAARQRCQRGGCAGVAQGGRGSGSPNWRRGWARGRGGSEHPGCGAGKELGLKHGASSAVRLGSTAEPWVLGELGAAQSLPLCSTQAIKQEARAALPIKYQGQHPALMQGPQCPGEPSRPCTPGLHAAPSSSSSSSSSPPSPAGGGTPRPRVAPPAPLTGPSAEHGDAEPPPAGSARLHPLRPSEPSTAAPRSRICNAFLPLSAQPTASCEHKGVADIK